MSIWATAFENWPADLRDLIEPLEEVPLTPDDVMAIGQDTPGFLAHLDREEDAPFAFDATTLANINDVFSRNPQLSFHLRLGIVSFKTEGPAVPASSQGDVLRQITRPNLRVAQFLVAMQTEGHHATLFFRPWMKILPWGHFRIIILERRVAGVTQSNAAQYFPEIAANEGAIRNAIVDLLHRIKSCLHLQDVVVEVAIIDTASGLSAQMIELNPAIQRTDIGLFDWCNRAEFNGIFLYNKVAK